MRHRAFAYLSAALCVAAALGVAGALAATDLGQRPGPAGCITESGNGGHCQDGRGLVGPEAIALSPDGANAYVAASSWDSVAILDRDPTSGGLTPVAGTDGCLSSLSSNVECAVGEKLGGARDLLVSPDGRNVYVAAPTDGMVTVLDRDGIDGELSQSGAGSAAAEAWALAISPDGESLYVVSKGNPGGILVFDRDPESGALVQKAGSAGCVNATGVSGCANGGPQMLDPRDVQVSPDGKSVYAVSRVHGAVTIFDRAADGSLTRKPGAAGCIDDEGDLGCTDGTALIEAEDVAISPGGETVYVGASRSDAVVVFDRDPDSGELTQKPGTAGCVSNTGASNPMHEDTREDCADGTALDGVDSIAITPDGSALYATAAESAGVAVFERHADGTIAQRPGVEGCITDTGRENPSLPYTAGACADGTSLIEASGVAAGPDSKEAYTTSHNGGVGIFDVLPAAGPPPAAGPAPATAGPVPVAVDLACVFARTDLRRATKAIRRQQSTIRDLVALHQPAAGSPLKKHRRLLHVWKERKAGAEARIAQQCS